MDQLNANAFPISLATNLALGMRMNENHWMTRAAPEALAGVTNRAHVVASRIGPGSGAECDYCRKPIEPGAIECTVSAVIFTEPRTLHFHRLCHRLWEMM